MIISEILLLRAFFWSILLGVVVDPRSLKLRGCGPAEVGPLRILGYTAAIGSVMFALESAHELPPALESADELPPVGVLRGGSDEEVTTEKNQEEEEEGKTMTEKNPAFRLMRYNGSKARVLYSAVKTAIKPDPSSKAKNIFEVKIGGKGRDMSGEKIDELVHSWFQDEVIGIDFNDNLPLSVKFIHRMQAIKAEIENKKCVGRLGKLQISAGDEGTSYVKTETGQHLEIDEQMQTEWERTYSLMTKTFPVGLEKLPENTRRKYFTFDTLVKYVDKKMMDKKVKFKFPGEADWTELNFENFKRLLDHEQRLRVCWENRWFAVTEDLLKLMADRIAGRREDPPPSLMEYKPSSDYDLLKLNRDGLFLVTQRMEDLEAKR